MDSAVLGKEKINVKEYCGTQFIWGKILYTNIRLSLEQKWMNIHTKWNK